MKHKRQTLGKSGDDGDDKDSVTSDGGKSTKLSDKFLDDEMSKKSCQGCELPSVGLCGSHEDTPDVGSTRGNNNNTPSATNNNTSFNNNSNGASSVASSGSFDKMLTEEDSRSNEDNGGHSGRKKANPSVPVKVETRRNSPSTSSERKISVSKMSPSIKDVLLPNADMKMSKVVPAMHTSPLGMAAGMVYPQMQRASPTTATAIASATVTIQNVPNNIPPFAARGSNFHQYPMNQVDYRQDRQSKHQYMHSQPGYTSGDMYNPDHPQVNENQPYFKNQMHNNHARRSDPSVSRSRQSYSGYSNQHYYNYKNHSGDGYQHINQYPQGYQHENYNYNHYPASMYTSEDNMHTANPVHMENSYYQNENMHQMQKVQSTEYPNKVGYYENNYNSPQIPATTEGYIPTEIYPNTTTMPAGGIMTPPTSVQTDTSDNYNSFHQFYPGEPQTQVAPTGENSNSSSDFNFLSNLANDYTPEYYQI